MAVKSVPGSQEIYKHPHKKGWFQGRVYYADLDTGKRRAKYFAERTKGEIQRKIEEFEALQRKLREERKRREEQPFLTKTVKDFLTGWFAAVEIRPTTRALYDSTLRTHVYSDETFCAKELGSLTTDDVTEFMGRRRDSNASENTRLRIYKLLHAAFQTAVDEERFPTGRNPVKLAKAKRPPKRRTKVVSFTPEHELALLLHVQDKPFWGPLLLLAFDSGMRQAEILGLQKSSVHANAHEISIDHTLNTAATETILEPVPKNDSSWRRVRVSKATLDALRGHLKAHLATASSFVFLDPDGTPWTRGNFNKAFTKLLKDAGIPHYHFHSTRHTCATRLLRSGMYITAVSKRLGHAKPSITLDIYSDALPSDQEKLADAFDATVACLKASSL